MKMNRGKPYFGGLTKTQLTQAIRAELGQYPIGQEFESALVAGLIAEKHYYCSKKGIKPARFRKSFRAGAAYDFEGFFPERGWHMVSWVQCITPRDEQDWLKRALRDAVQPIVAAYKSAHPKCELCPAPSEHVDHVAPEFDSMVKEAMSLLNQQQLDAAFAQFDWWSKEAFSLPALSPAIQSVLAAHNTAQLRAVCQPCHTRSSKERRNAQQGKSPTS